MFNHVITKRDLNLMFILLVGKQDVFSAWYLGEEAVRLGLVALLPSVPFKFPFVILIFHSTKRAE